jgi:hypothetical protein
LVLLAVGSAVALPIMTDCNPIRGAATATSTTEPMGLWGRWLGMMLASADSATARSVGIPAGIAGVVVADVGRDGASRAAQAGLAPGDVVVKVDGTTTGNLADLYTLTTRLNTARSVPLEVLRQGQPMTIVLPPPGAAPMQQQVAMQPQAPGAWNAPSQPPGPQAAVPQAMAPQAIPPQAMAPPQVPPQPIAPQPAAPAAPQPAALGAPTAAAIMPPANLIPGAMGR